MKINGIIDALAAVFQFTFKGLEALGNLPNLIFLIIGFIGFIYWMLQLNKYKNEPNN